MCEQLTVCGAARPRAARHTVALSYDTVKCPHHPPVPEGPWSEQARYGGGAPPATPPVWAARRGEVTRALARTQQHTHARAALASAVFMLPSTRVEVRQYPGFSRRARLSRARQRRDRHREPAARHIAVAQQAALATPHARRAAGGFGAGNLHPTSPRARVQSAARRPYRLPPRRPLPCGSLHEASARDEVKLYESGG